MAVFAGARQRDNNAFGTITDNPLTAGAVTLNSAGLANVSAVSGNHVALVLDPLRTAGAPEIVIVTAHTGAATSATITRGAYGTVARSHAAGVLWVLAATADDLVRICTSSTRPTDAYEGQLIFETDTNKYVGHGGVDWHPVDAGGVIGYAAGTTTQAAVGAVVDVTSCSIAVTVGTGRRIKITGRINTGVASAIDTNVFMLIQEGATEVGRVAGMHSAGGKELTLYGATHLTPTAGAHTYKLTVQASGGTVTVGQNVTNAPQFILVEDIGAA